MYSVDPVRVAFYMLGAENPLGERFDIHRAMRAPGHVGWPERQPHCYDILVRVARQVFSRCRPSEMAEHVASVLLQ